MSVSGQPAILVIPNPQYGWDILNEATSISYGHCPRQDDALDQARAIGTKLNCDVFVVQQSKRIPILEYKET